jgi:hypothetical protein
VSGADLAIAGNSTGVDSLFNPEAAAAAVPPTEEIVVTASRSDVAVAVSTAAHAVDLIARAVVFDYQDPLGGSYLIEAATLLPGTKLAKLRKLHAAEEVATTVIGRVRDLTDLPSGYRSLLDRLPNRGNPRANWRQNAGVLRSEMTRGLPIRDMSPGDTAGNFLNAERSLLRDRRWTFDGDTNYWMPPEP